tara:strand:+ start:42 stop:605 length:564 start_codon:yes stop_codon:yes gene_type:complete
MRNLLVVLVLGLILTSCEKEPLDDWASGYSGETNTTEESEYKYIKDTISKDGDVFLIHFIEKGFLSAYELRNEDTLFNRGVFKFDYGISYEYSDVFIISDLTTYELYDVYIYLVRKNESVKIYSGVPIYKDSVVMGANYTGNEDEKLFFIPRKEFKYNVDYLKEYGFKEVDKNYTYSDTPYRFTNYE